VNYSMINNLDGNQIVELKSDSLEDALVEALQSLGWSLIGDECNDDDDPDDPDVEHFDDDDFVFCNTCNGTGEGMHEGLTCPVCHGEGVRKPRE